MVLTFVHQCDVTVADLRLVLTFDSSDHLVVVLTIISANCSLGQDDFFFMNCSRFLFHASYTKMGGDDHRGSGADCPMSCQTYIGTGRITTPQFPF